MITDRKTANIDSFRDHHTDVDASCATDVDATKVQTHYTCSDKSTETGQKKKLKSLL